MKNRFSDVKIIMGLGNPDESYGNTYHNVGKLLIEHLREIFARNDDTKTTDFRRKTSGSNFETYLTGKITLVKPTNYMNENGKAAKAVLKSSGSKSDSLLVAHDDSDIELGKYKISFGRGTAGHNGVESVIENIGTKNFWRLRVGIGKSMGSKKIKAGDLVLKKISMNDRKFINSAFDDAIKEIFGDAHTTFLP